jgi:uncharacterized cupin superfamily protein
MDKVRIDDVEAWTSPASVKRSISRALDASHVSLNYYELAPGESMAFGYHKHDSQEELFVVQSGTMIFETETGDVNVEEGSAIRFAPGEYQQGTNEGDERATVLAIGAPKDAGDTEVLRECPECGKRTPNEIERATEKAGLVTRCAVCDAETGHFT